VVAPGASARFLARCPIEVLDRPELAGLLRRLGIATLGALAAMSRNDLVARFGPEGASAHLLANGCDDRPLEARAVPPELAVAIELDPPASRIDQVAFAAKMLADGLHQELAARGLACTQVAIEAETESGERRCRLWRHQGALSAAAVAERVRWQLDGWLHAPSAPTSGICRLRLIPDEVTADRGRQLGFWGGQTDSDDRALRALVRLAAHLGRDAVLVPVPAGGRGIDARHGLVPLDSVDVLGRLDTTPTVPPGPWPGQLPAPSPAIVYPQAIEVAVLDADGLPVTVSGRGELSAAPQRWVIDGRSRAVAAWAGPWCVEERWWDARRSRRHARLQLVAGDGMAAVVTRESGAWWWEATYD
jgi:protein ImuB